MANAFKNKAKTLSNDTLAAVFTDASPSASFYIAKVAPVPEGSSLVFADIKLNLESGDILKAKSSHASGHLDVFASVLEIT